MNTKIKNNRLFIFAALAVCLVASAGAATLTFNAAPPAVDGYDIAQLAPKTGGAMIWGDRPSVGQSFLTGDQLSVLNAVTFQSHTESVPKKVYQIRIGTLSGEDFTEITKETFTVDVSWTPDDFITWTLDTPVELAANTVYAFDLGLVSSTTGWQSGIPQVSTCGNEYDGGSMYNSNNGLPGATVSLKNNNDLVFHLDIGASSVDPELPTVEAGSDWVTWSGAAVALDDAFVINNSTSNLIINWSADANDVTVDFSATDAEAPTITITKDPGDPVTVTFTVAANYEGSTSDDVVDTMTIDVYDTPCLAAGAFGEVVLDATDINEDCITDVLDLYELAAKWLVTYKLDAPAVK